MARRILIAGIGNIFLGDDAFGVEVAQLLAQRSLPDGVRVVDFGIRGFDLAYALLDGYDATILVDTAPRGRVPGTLYLIEPDLAEATGDGAQGSARATIATHNVNPVEVLALVNALGGRPGRLYVVGCEPATFGEDEGGYMGLSPPVQAALAEAVRRVMALVEEILAEGTGRNEVQEVRQ